MARAVKLHLGTLETRADGTRIPQSRSIGVLLLRRGQYAPDQPPSSNPIDRPYHRRRRLQLGVLEVEATCDPQADEDRRPRFRPIWRAGQQLVQLVRGKLPVLAAAVALSGRFVTASPDLLARADCLPQLLSR